MRFSTLIKHLAIGACLVAPSCTAPLPADAPPSGDNRPSTSTSGAHQGTQAPTAGAHTYLTRHSLIDTDYEFCDSNWICICAQQGGADSSTSGVDAIEELCRSLLTEENKLEWERQFNECLESKTGQAGAHTYLTRHFLFNTDYRFGDSY